MVEPTESEPLDELDRFCDAMIAIRDEIAQVESGAWPKDDNPLKQAPHTADWLLKADWPHPYTREQAAYPVPSLQAAEVLVAGRPGRQRLGRPQPVVHLPAAERLRGLGFGMAVSVFDLFKIGIGPSQLAHRRADARGAPVRAAARRTTACSRARRASGASCSARSAPPARATAATRRCCSGSRARSPTRSTSTQSRASSSRSATAAGSSCSAGTTIAFDERADLIFHRRETLPLPRQRHALHRVRRRRRRAARAASTTRSAAASSSSDEAAADGTRLKAIAPDTTCCRIRSTAATSCSRSRRALDCASPRSCSRTRRHWRTDAEIDAGAAQHLARDAGVRGARLQHEGMLPGGLKVKRRARGAVPQASQRDPRRRCAIRCRCMDWVNLFALAVNEENAAGGRVVTAPTNGAAGIIPAVLTTTGASCPTPTTRAWSTSCSPRPRSACSTRRTPRSRGAEVGCQGEVGVACSMAAGALAEVMGGTPAQVENAAEIGMEHNLGLTCDPIGGLVQVPCIERNAMASVKAINAARLALHGDGTPRRRLDKVIKTMRETGADMTASTRRPRAAASPSTSSSAETALPAQRRAQESAVKPIVLISGPQRSWSARSIAARVARTRPSGFEAHCLQPFDRLRRRQRRAQCRIGTLHDVGRPSPAGRSRTTR